LSCSRIIPLLFLRGRHFYSNFSVAVDPLCTSYFQMPATRKIQQQIRMLGDVSPAVEADPAVRFVSTTPYAPAGQTATKVVGQKGPGFAASFLRPGSTVDEPIASFKGISGADFFGAVS
jgi:hypothetical protein